MIMADPSLIPGLWLPLLYLQVLFCFAAANGATETPQQCRDRDSYYLPEAFNLKSCGDCYKYLFPDQTAFVLIQDGMMISQRPASVNDSSAPQYDVIWADVHNETTTDSVCLTLRQRSQCAAWKQCCYAGEECCQKQTKEPIPHNASTCPRTWDGFSCWGDTIAGVTASARCPRFMDFASRTARVHKVCTMNATWFVHSDGLEWTDYTACSDITLQTKIVVIGLICQILSLSLLIPATMIFIYFRDLRKQHRIRLHINLFLSFILTAVTFIAWDTMSFPGNENIIGNNGVGCRLLYILSRYGRTTNYIWMLCEGYYLHRLIAHAFQPPKRIWMFYILGWGLPVFPVGIYSVLRVVYANSSCWINDMGHMEWIIYAPCILSLMLNVFFLGNILRILLTKLHYHPNEPNNYRRALKASLMLIPLFGVQLVLIIYRPPYHSAVSDAYEIAAAVITHSQGFMVALIFCFCNAEVHNLMKKTWKTWRGKSQWGDKRHDSTSTQVSEYSHSVSAVAHHQNGRHHGHYTAVKTAEDETKM